MMEKMNKINEWKKVSLSDLEHVAEELKGLVEEPTCLILEGDLGAGKTTS